MDNPQIILDVLKNPYKIIKHIGGKGYLRWIPDEPYLKMCYRAAFGKKLNLTNPTSFNEKIQWLKLYNRQPIYSTMVDKAAVKDYVAEIIGKKYVIPTLGIWDNFDKIDFESLPDKFVLKSTHDSGRVLICTNKDELDIKKIRKQFNKNLKRNFYYVGREWAYKNVVPKIIAETYMTDESGYELKDYKVFCFSGIPRIIQVDYNRFTNHKRNIYDSEWKYMDFKLQYPTDKEHIISKPENLKEMLTLAQKLSQGLPFLRADFYQVKNQIYVGELTLYPENGFGHFDPVEYDNILGSWIDIADDKI